MGMLPVRVVDQCVRRALRRHRKVGTVTLVLGLVGSCPALAQEATASDESKDAPAEEPPSDPRLEPAREAFRHGAELVARADWSEALTAFEKSAALRSHPVTTFNIGVCQRALGQYLRARESLRDALSQDAAAGGQLLSQTLVAQARALTDEIDRMLVRVKVHLVPMGARIAVDGRPLARSPEGKQTVLLSGLLPPGRGTPAPAERFELLVEPGTRIFSLSRPGFSDVIVKRTFAPGSTPALNLELARLPAALRVESDRSGAVVTVQNIDVGVVPVEVSRPAGTYDVVVKKPGFVSYETRVALRAGEQASLRAKLPKVEPAITERWWFWTAAGAVVVGAAATTYALTRPDPERPPPNGGSLGWIVETR